jgi:hypothetical protein
MRQTIYFISGPAGVGKSTTSVRLVQSLERSAYISGDDISHIPVNGRGQPWLCEETLNLTWKNILDLSRNLVISNYDVVIDYVTFPKELDWFLERVKDLNVKVIYVILMVDEVTLKFRDDLRPLENQMGERSLILLQEFRNSIIDERHVLETQNYIEDEINTILIDITSNSKYVVVSGGEV